MVITPQQKEYIEHVTLFDDHFFAACFDNQPECFQQILNPCFAYLSETPPIVESVKTQEQITSVTGKTIRLDALAIDKEGKRVDIEIQRVSQRNLIKRSRYYSSLLDSVSLKIGEDYDQMPNTFVIFLTEHDYLKTGKAVTKIGRTIYCNGKPFEDGNYILFVDGSYHSDDSIGRLIHDLKCSDPSKMLNEVLRNRVRMFKETSEGVKIMSGIEEKIARNAEAKGKAEEKEKFILNLLKNGFDYEQIALYTESTVQMIKKLHKRFQAEGLLPA